jgi:colanic acid/amylovoran biosynthesis protein
MVSSARNILMINLHSTQNAGDAALSDMAVACMRIAFPGARMTLAMNEPDPAYETTDPDGIRVVCSFAALCGAAFGRPRLGALIRIVAASLAAAAVYRARRRPPSWLPSDLRPLLSAYMDADLAVSKPGNVFATMGRVGMPFLLEAVAAAYAVVLGKPLYVLPQSIGPLRRRWERAAVRGLFSKARTVYVREPVSMRLAQEIGLPAQRLYLVPDMAFALPQATAEEAVRVLEAAGAGTGLRVGVTVINRLIRHVSQEDWDRYEMAVADTLARFARTHGVTVVFFPQVIGPTEREDDRVAARRIMARMGQGNRAVLLEEPVPPKLLKAMYGEMELMVATRMHSAIFALSNGVPTLMIEYLHKIRGLAEMLGMEQWALSLTEVNGTTLERTLEALWKDRLAVRYHLGRLMPGLVLQIASVSEAIARDYYAR